VNTDQTKLVSGDVVLGGLPEDWGKSTNEPLRFTLPQDWLELVHRYGGMGPSKPLDNTFELVARGSPTSALLERDYIDADYRDEFSHFYAQTFRRLPDRCERLHFFSSDKSRERYLGYLILRPILGRPVCRTMLSPPRGLTKAVSCVASSSSTPYGYAHNVRGFPYISQDYQYGVCSHAALWMVAFYFHLEFARPRYYLSDIASAAVRHQDLLPSLPSDGLTLRQIMGVLHDLKMPPITYRIDRELPRGEDMETIACRYLNSRLPVILLKEQHATVLVGYGHDEHGFFFVSHDDATGPYLKIRNLRPTEGDGAQGAIEGKEGHTAEGRGGWEALLVPVPGRIYLTGEAAEYTARTIFEEELKRKELSGLASRWSENGLRLRTYATKLASYKRALRTRKPAPHPDVVAWHANMSASNWIWVTELQDREAAANSHACVLGEIAIDATSDDQWPNPVFGNLPGMTLRWPELGLDLEWARSEQGETPYASGAAIHS